MNDGIGCSQVKAYTARFQADQKNRYFSILEVAYGGSAVCRVSCQNFIRNASVFQLGFDETQHTCELGENENMPFFKKEFVQHFHQFIQFG